MEIPPGVKGAVRPAPSGRKSVNCFTWLRSHPARAAAPAQIIDGAELSVQSENDFEGVEG
jgi:hypothetical protein